MNSDKIIKVKHYVTSTYGWRIHPITGKKTFHYGTDYGTDNKSIATYPYKNGVVHNTGYHRSMGNFVVIRYDFSGQLYYSRHQHLKSISCYKGQYVDNNTIVGYVGTTGSSTGIHLHFQWFKGTYNEANSINFETWEEPKPKIKEGIVTANVLNVREGGGIKYRIIGTLKKGQKVRLGNYNKGWWNIYFGDHGGFVSAFYIKEV